MLTSFLTIPLSPFVSPALEDGMAELAMEGKYKGDGGDDDDVGLNGNITGVLELLVFVVDRVKGGNNANDDNDDE